MSDFLIHTNYNYHAFYFTDIEKYALKNVILEFLWQILYF